MKRSDLLSYLRAGWLSLLLLALPLLAAGCGTSKTPHLYGASTENPDKLPDYPSDQLSQITSAPTAVAIQEGAGSHCPQVVAWPRDRLLTVYQAGHSGDAKAVVHRGEITKMSRECQFYAGRVVVKYGFAGRVLLGPKGGPGTVSLPVSIRVAGADQRTLATDRMIIPTTVPHNSPVGYFSMVREIAFPIMVGSRPEDYKIFVAFDRPQGQG